MREPSAGLVLALLVLLGALAILLSVRGHQNAEDRRVAELSCAMQGYSVGSEAFDRCVDRES